MPTTRGRKPANRITVQPRFLMPDLGYVQLVGTASVHIVHPRSGWAHTACGMEHSPATLRRPREWRALPSFDARQMNLCGRCVAWARKSGAIAE